jgi:hypothetical protein
VVFHPFTLFLGFVSPARPLRERGGGLSCTVVGDAWKGDYRRGSQRCNSRVHQGPDKIDIFILKGIIAQSYRTLRAVGTVFGLGTELLRRPASDVRPDSACSRFHDQRSDGARVVLDGHMTATRQRFELGAGRELIEVPGLVP